MRKKLSFMLLLLLCLFFIDGIFSKAFAQSEDIQYKSQKKLNPNKRVSYSILIQDLVKMEKQNPTSSQNAEKRYKMLRRIIYKMLKSKEPVNDILSQDDDHRIKEFIKSGDLDTAAHLITKSIMKLKNHSSGNGHKIASTGSKFSKKLHSNKSDKIDRELKDNVEIKNIVISSYSERINIQKLITKESFGNIVKLMNPVIDPKRRRLYITGTRSTHVGVIDLVKNKLIDTFDIAVTGGFLVLDSNSGDLYLFQINRKKYYKIDINKKKAVNIVALPPHVSLPKRGTPKIYKGFAYLDSGHPFRVGYLQNKNASYGIINVKNSKGEKVSHIMHGPAGLYFDIDSKTGKLYASNTGNSSISVFDLEDNNKIIKDIKVGTTIEEVLFSNDTRSLYLMDRLGGSKIYNYDLKTNRLLTLTNENAAGSKGIGMWPAQMIFHDDMLYVLSHYGGRIDVIETKAHKVTASINIPLSYKPRTDALSTMIMDKTERILYAAFPELGELAVIDAKKLKTVKIKKIEKVSIQKHGPAGIILGFDKKLNRLYAYFPDQKMLHAYSSDTLALEKNKSVFAKKTRGIMTVHSEKGVLYLGNKIMDAVSLDVKDSFKRGTKVIAYDNSNGRVYLLEEVRLGPSRMIEKIYEFENMELKSTWTLSPIISIPSSFQFDFKNRKFYVGYFESALLESFDLDSGEKPTQSPLLNEKSSDNDGKKQKCGDGRCQPVERKTGVCPEDCKGQNR